MFKGKTQQLLGGILIGVLVVGLAGFSITSFSGGSLGSVGRVGNTEITAEAYARAIDQQMRAASQNGDEPMTFAEAQSLGLDRIALSQLVTRTALVDAARELGLSASDERVAEAIQQIPQFQAEGGFDGDAYRYALGQLGFSVAEFEAETRQDIATGILRTAIGAGVEVPPVLTETLVDYLTAERDVTWATVPPPEGAVGEPTEEQIAAFHDANPEPYTTPQVREITYAALTPEGIAETVEVDEADIAAAYEAAGDRYRQPERRLVERVVFPDIEAAQAAADRIAAGETDFAGLVEERGLTLADVDLGEVARGDLGSAAEAVFALEEPGIAGPAETSLGPALFRVNAILSAQETPLEDAREEIAQDIRLSRAGRALAQARSEIADLIAGGATLEDLAAQTPMNLDSVAWTVETTEGVPGDPSFRLRASEIREGAFPELIELESGGIASLRLDGVREPELRPLADVRDQVVADWRAVQAREAAVERAETAAAEIREGADPTDLGLETQSGTLTRDGGLDGAPSTLVDALSGAEAGEVLTVAAEDSVTLARVDDVRVPEDQGETGQALADAFVRQASQSISADLTQAFAQAALDRATVSIDQSAVDAVLSQFR